MYLKFLLSLFIIGLFVSPVSSMVCSVPSQVEVNTAIPVKCSTNYTMITSCLLESYDFNGNIVQTWNTIPDDNGQIMKVVSFDDKYSVGKNYTLNVSCVNETSANTIFVDVGGNVGLNLFAGNMVAYTLAHPEESIAFVLVSFLGVCLMVGLVKFVRK